MAFWILISLLLFIQVGTSIVVAILGGGIATFLIYLVCLCIMVFDGVS